MDVVGMAKALAAEGAMTDLQIVRRAIEDHEATDEFRWMQKGLAYYRNENDIRVRQQFKYVNGVRTVDGDKVNNRLAHPFMKLAIDEKVAYLLGEPPTYDVDDPNWTPPPAPEKSTISTEGGPTPDAQDEEHPFLALLNDTLDDEFDDQLNDVGKAACNAGIGWLHVFIGDEGEQAFSVIPSDQCVPLWADEGHTKLDALVRHYYVTEYEGQTELTVHKVELWTPLTVEYFSEFGGDLVMDIEKMGENEVIGHFQIGDAMYGWGRVPFIPFKNNSEEMPDLQFVKGLIDEYDKTVSDNANLLEDITQLTYVLKNYGGVSLEEFVTELKFYRAIKVDEDGGVDVLKADVNPTATEAHLDRLKRDFHEFGQSVDKSLDKLGSSPSGVALEFLYSGLKLKASAMERKFKTAMKQVFWFVARYAEVASLGKYDPSMAGVTFTRSSIRDIKASIDAVNAAVTTHSLRTSLAHSPWVDDVDEELARIEEESKSQTTSLDAALQAGRPTMMTTDRIPAEAPVDGSAPPSPGDAATGAPVDAQTA